MNERQIQAFIEICELGSMNRAAEKIYISQPALKRRIDLLEEEIGTTLFIRKSNGCYLTKAGEVFRDGLKELMEELHLLMQRTREADERKILRICTMPDIAMKSQDRMLIEFARRNQDVEIERVILPTSEWIEAVCSGEADVCSCFCTGEMPEVLIQRNLRMKMGKRWTETGCILSSRHPLANRERLSAADLKDYKVGAGPILYGYGGLREYAAANGMNVFEDERAGKRYEMIESCEKGIIYLHPMSLAQVLEPLAIIPFDGFSCVSSVVYKEKTFPMLERYLDFYEEIS